MESKELSCAVVGITKTLLRVYIPVVISQLVSISRQVISLPALVVLGSWLTGGSFKALRVWSGFISFPFGRAFDSSDSQLCSGQIRSPDSVAVFLASSIHGLCNAGYRADFALGGPCEVSSYVIDFVSVS